MNLKQFLKPSSENLTASGDSAFRSPKRMSNFYYWVKPDWRKIVIFVISLVLSSYHIFGFPLESQYMIGGCEERNGKMICWDALAVNWYFFAFNVLIRLIIFYLLSCFIIWIYDKVKKKS